MSPPFSPSHRDRPFFMVGINGMIPSIRCEHDLTKDVEDSLTCARKWSYLVEAVVKRVLDTG